MDYYIAAFAIFLYLVNANTAGSIKRSFVNAIFFISNCLGNIAGRFAFKTSEAPAYISQIVAVPVSYCASAFLLIAFAFYAMMQNKIKADLLAVLGGDEEGVLDASMFWR